MKKNSILLLLITVVTITASCSKKEEEPVEIIVQKTQEEIKLEQNMEKLTTILETANPFNNSKGEASAITQNILANKEAFLHDLEIVLAKDREMAAPDGDYPNSSFFIRADKQVSAPEGYIPPNLVSLTKETGDAGNYMINRNDLSLRKPVEYQLARMATLAANDGVTLLVSSTYRSAEYQAIVFQRNVDTYGLEMAERDSARAGTSQHQLGTVIDFGSITNDFYDTKAGIWMRENAPSLGWSLSFPPEYESVTGYVWESWHWRYIGVEAVKFQQKWFKDIQQYMIEFIYSWQNS